VGGEDGRKGGRCTSSHLKIMRCSKIVLNTCSEWFCNFYPDLREGRRVRKNQEERVEVRMGKGKGTYSLFPYFNWSVSAV